MSAVNDLTEDELRRLAETSAEEDTVLSVYVDLDPERFPTPRERASEIDSLLDSAERESREGERSHAAKMALRSSLARARELLAADGEWVRGARSYALFLCEPLGLERGLRLPQPLAGAAVISDAPFIAPLTEEGAAGRVCVALIDERFARILRGSGTQLREVSSFGDDVHGRTSKGGWSQARWQRSRHEEVDGHLRHVARTLQLLLRVRPYQRLLIACTEPLWPQVLERLHPEVRALLDERRVQLDVGDAGIEQVLAAVAPLLEREHAEHEDAVLAELRARLGHGEGERAVSGLERVLAALVERRVQALLYDAGLSVPGVACPRCGWLGVDAQSCPVDGGPLEQRENVIEEAVRAAVEQDAEVLPLRDRPDLGPLGGIAATLRF